MGRNTTAAVLISVFIIMVFAFVYEGNLSALTGNAVTGNAALSTSNVYDYLLFVDNHPEQFQIVVGKYAKPYEVEYAKKFAEYFGIIYNNEKSVSSRNHLILYGTPDTNQLLDNMYSYVYDKTDSRMVVENENLIIVVSGELQAERFHDLIVNFRSNHDKLMLSEMRMDIGDIFGVAVVVIVAVVSLFLLIVDISRKRAIRMDKYKHTMSDLENYIKKYSKEGRNVFEIKEWLTGHGYEADMVDKAIANVRTNLSNKTS